MSINDRLIDASRRGDLEKVKELITAGANVNYLDSAHYWARRYGHSEVVEFLEGWEVRKKLGNTRNIKRIELKIYELNAKMVEEDRRIQNILSTVNEDINFDMVIDSVIKCYNNIDNFEKLKKQYTDIMNKLYTST